MYIEQQYKESARSLDAKFYHPAPSASSAPGASPSSKPTLRKLR